MPSYNRVLGPNTALDHLDPNHKWVYGTVCPIHAEFYEMQRIVYVGESFQDLTGRSSNNVTEIHKTTPFLSYNKALVERGLRPITKYLPFPTERESLEFFEYANLLNVAKAGGGRKPTVTWTPVHVEAALSDRPYADLVAEYGIAAHHWRRLRHRYRDVQRPENWFTLEDLRWWSIDDLYLILKPTT